MKTLLIIDDEPGHRLMVRAVLEDAGWRVLEAGSGREGVELFGSAAPAPDVALVDMRMPGMDGQQTLAALHEKNPGLPVVLLTAYGTVGAAVEAMKRGAFDYLTKPADNDELVLTLNRAWEYSRVVRENHRLRNRLSGEGALQKLVGRSAAMHAIHEFIRQAGPSEATILITGESGTGKELIAEGLHASSARVRKPLVKVNCAALPAHLLESELFGYERGAFTGAVRDKPGRFQLASGGTLFLDEIGELPLDLQAKLLRAIQERVVEPLGSVRPQAVDVRILAATNRDLRQAVADGGFREDLFFRLNVLEVEAPPLRERLDDLPVLVSHLLGRLSEKNRKNVRSVSPAFLQILSMYSWPGNIRELENVLERALILSRADILDVESLPARILAGSEPCSAAPGTTQTPSAPAAPPVGAAENQVFEGSGSPLPAAVAPHSPGHGSPAPLASDPDTPEGYPPAGPVSPLEEAERAALLQTLALHRGHRERTAQALGISRRTLQYKLKKFGLNKRGG